jgi:hypothetical protein
MTEPARTSGALPGPPSAAEPRYWPGVSAIAVPVSVWPAIPAPARCPASPGCVPCPRRYASTAARAVISALSRSGDLVAVPGPEDEVFLAAAASAGRRAAGPGCAGAAALAVVSACPVPGCRLPGTAAGDTGPDRDPGQPWAACQRALGPGGLLAVITAAVRHPGWAGQLIAHARAVGLVYAQHVIALHAPLHGDRLLSPPPPQPCASAASPAETRHLPVHTDLLLFVQPGGARHD